MPKFNDKTGMVFGKLTVIEMAPERTKNLKIVWKCQCSCGNICLVCAQDLTRGHTKSCGCASSEGLIERSITHGQSKTQLYKKWKGMKGRCYNPNNKYYSDYGGRGITVCDEWRNDFMSFYSWAQSSGYEGNLTIERLDVDGDYNPTNCTWISMSEQGWNKRNTLLVEFQGTNMALAKAVRLSKTKLPYMKIRYWIVERGYSFEQVTREFSESLD